MRAKKKEEVVDAVFWDGTDSAFNKLRSLCAPLNIGLERNYLGCLECTYPDQITTVFPREMYILISNGLLFSCDKDYFEEVYDVVECGFEFHCPVCGLFGSVNIDYDADTFSAVNWACDSCGLSSHKMSVGSREEAIAAVNWFLSLFDGEEREW